GVLCPANQGLGKWLGYLDKFFVFPQELTKQLHSLNGTPAVVHICDHSNAFYTKFLAHIPHVVTCNDLLAIRSARGEFPENRTRWTGRQLQKIIIKGLNRAQ